MRKILTILLSIVLVVTSISVAFVASAAEVNANVDSVTEYDTTSSPTLSSENRLSGVPYYVNNLGSGSYRTINTSGDNQSTTWLFNNSLNDSNISGRSGKRFADGLEHTDNIVSGNTKAKIVLTLGKMYDIDELLVAGSSNQNPITSFEIYLGDDFDTLFNTENKVVEYTRETGSTKHIYHIKLKEKVSYIYYGIKFTGVDKDTKVVSDKSIYMNELGAYGTVNTTFETPTTLPTDKNRIETDYAESFVTFGDVTLTNTNVGNSSTAGSTKHFTNGNLDTSLYDARLTKANRLYLNNSTKTVYHHGMYMTWDLGGTYDVSKVLLATGQGNSNYCGEEEWKLYISDSSTELFNPENAVAHIVDTRDGVANQLLQLVATNKQGRYVGFEFIRNAVDTETVFISEIAVYGTPTWCAENIQTLPQSLGDNILKGITTIKHKDSTGTALTDRTTGASNQGSISSLFDGNTTASITLYNSYAAGKRMLFQMEASKTVTVSAAMFAAKTSASGTEVFSWEAYVSDSADTLFNKDNLFAVCDNTKKSQTSYVFVDENGYKTGKYFGIAITGYTGPNTTMYASEIAFYEAPKATITSTSSADYSAPGYNLLDGKNLYYTGQTDTTVNTTTPRVKLPQDTNGNEVSLLTDGNLRNNAGNVFGTGLRVYNGYKTRYVYDMENNIDISKILIASGVPASGSNASGTAYADSHSGLLSYALFVADDEADIFNLNNRVAYYYNISGNTIQTFDFADIETKGRYLGIYVYDAKTTTTSILLTEFAVYGNVATDAYTVVNEPSEDEIPANELEYATLTDASDDANGILTDGTVYFTGADANAALTFEDADTKSFTYDLDATVSINSFLIGSKYDVNINLTPAHYKIYVADTLVGLDTATAIVDYYPANYVANSGTYQGSVQQFVLKNAAQGRFVRFEFTKAALANNDINLTELGVYTNAEAVVNLTGTITAPVAVYTDGTTAEFEVDNNQLKLAAAMSRGQHSVVVADNAGNTEVYFLDKGAATRKEALDNAFTNKSALLESDAPFGIEFKSTITDAAKAEADEIGIVVAKKATLNGADLTENATAYKNATAVAYNSTVNHLNGNDFSATVHNFEQYKYLYRYAARPYIKVDGLVVYGVPFDTTPAEAAKAIVDNKADYSDELVAYAQNIVDNSGLSEVALARADFLRLESTKTDSLDAAATLANSVACNTNTNLARLKAVIEKAQRGEDIVLATLGGSITQGFNANYNPATGKSELDRSTHCWSNLLREWLQNTFDVNVTLYNAGIGSTTSVIGVGRVVSDVLSHNPDLVVIDYAVNDVDSTQYPSMALTKTAYEALTRRILESGNDVALMMLFNAKQNLDDDSQEGLYAEIGNHYGVPMISYHDAIEPLIVDGTYAWSDFSNDTIHPHAYGHQVIAALFGHYLAGVIENIGDITDTVEALPTETIYEDAIMMQSSTLYHSDTLPTEWVESYGSFEVSHNIHSQFPNGWLADYSNGTEPMVIKVPNARKLIFLVHDKKQNGNAVYGEAELAFDGTNATMAEAKLQTTGNNDMANAILRYESDTSGEVKVTITPKITAELQQFKLLGIIVVE